MLDYLLFLIPSLRIMFLINKVPPTHVCLCGRQGVGTEVTRVLG